MESLILFVGLSIVGTFGVIAILIHQRIKR